MFTAIVVTSPWWVPAVQTAILAAIVLRSID